MTVIAALLVLHVWAAVVLYAIFITDTQIKGKIDPKPMQPREVVELFLWLWMLPAAVFVAIWGGIFWW